MLEEAIIVADQKTEEIINDIKDAILQGISSAINDINSQIEKLKELDSLKSEISSINNDTSKLTGITKSLDEINFKIIDLKLFKDDFKANMPNYQDLLLSSVSDIERFIKQMTTDILSNQKENNNLITKNITGSFTRVNENIDNWRGEINLQFEEKFKIINEALINILTGFSLKFSNLEKSIVENNKIINDRLNDGNNNIKELKRSTEFNNEEIAKLLQIAKKNNETDNYLILQIEEIKRDQMLLLKKYNEKWYKKLFNIFLNGSN